MTRKYLNYFWVDFFLFVLVKKEDHLSREPIKVCTVQYTGQHYSIFIEGNFEEKKRENLASLVCHFTMDFFLSNIFLLFDFWTFFLLQEHASKRMKEGTWTERMHENHKKIWNALQPRMDVTISYNNCNFHRVFWKLLVKYIIFI